MYCRGRYATDPIWRVLASSDGISSWTRLKPQHSNPNPNPNSGVLTSLILPHISSSLTDSLPSLSLLCHSKTDARSMQDDRKAVWSIQYISAVFLPSLKHNFIVYRSSKVFDCIFEIHQQWQSSFIRVYSNSCCNYSFEPKTIKFVSHLIRCIPIRYGIFKSLRQFSMPIRKMLVNLSYAPCIFLWLHFD